MDPDIVIIGGGASGLAAAISAARTAPAAKIVVAERLDRVGKKILSTGNGRCNLGNRRLSAQRYHGSVRAMDLISRTPSAEEFFRSLGILCREDSEGRLYPYSNAAASVLTGLRSAAEALGVETVCGFEAAGIVPGEKGFLLRSADGRTLRCRRLIVAAGGYAAPGMGTDGGVMRMLREMGYKTAKLCPAVAPLKVSPDKLRGLKGVRVKGEAAAVSGGKILHRESGEIQFTETAISGICVFDLAWLMAGFEGRLTLRLDIAAELSHEELFAYLRLIRKNWRERPAEELLTGLFQKNLAVYLAKRFLGVPLSEKIGRLSDDALDKLSKVIKALEFEVTGASPWQNAQSTMGGIHADCVDGRLESRLHPGLFLCGEILDTAGDCGGYNLQWAWSSGIQAGRCCAESLGKGVRK